ncbi:MAG: pyrroline-5-carboxylate reductase [Candidatus Marinamargulisbacteria bacterium]
MNDNTIGFIGYGNMGAAIGAAILRNHQTRILICEKNDRLVNQQTNAGINAEFCDLKTLFQKSTIVFLCVKPQVVSDLANDCSMFIEPHHTLVSMLAGTSTATLSNLFQTQNIVRIMPNTPAILGAGVTGLYVMDQVPDAQQKVVHGLCDLFGQTIALDDEDNMHVITALSGSGPAFFYQFIAAFKSFGEANGLDEATALQAAIGTMYGAAKMLEKEPNPEALVQRVASPNGTTQAGLDAYDALNVEGGITGVLAAAKQRSIELMMEDNV